MNHSFARRLVTGGLAGVLGLGLGLPTLAQGGQPEPGTPGQARGQARGKRHAARDRALNLTDAQKAQLKTSRRELHARIRAIRANAALSDAEKKAQIRAARAEFRQGMLALLTPEQRAKAEAGRGRREGRRGRKDRRARRLGRLGARSARSLQRLNLSAAQQERLEDAREAYRKRAAAIRAAGGTSEQQREAFREAARAFRAELQATLTPEQLEQLRAGRRGGGRAAGRNQR